MNWLITGGCGFVGTSLIKHLLKDENNKIRVIDNLVVGTKDDLRKITDFKEINSKNVNSHSNNSVELYVGDILDSNLANKITKNTDVLVHLAANTGVGPSVDDPHTDCLTNVIGTLNYLEAARKNNIKKFIFASSGAPVGEVEPPIHEEILARPVSPYGASKLAGEGYCSAYFKTFKINTVALRFGNVYGPGSCHKSSIVAKFIRMALNNEVLTIYGDGNQTRDFIYINDLVNAIIISANKEDIGGEIFQIATNTETSVNEIVSIITNELKKLNFNEIKIIHEKVRLGDVRRNYSNNEKAKMILSWNPEMPLERGIIKTINYFTN